MFSASVQVIGKRVFFFVLSTFFLQSPMGSGIALAISQASHFLQPPPHQSIIIERMHSGMSSVAPYILIVLLYYMYILKYMREQD